MAVGRSSRKRRIARAGGGGRPRPRLEIVEETRGAGKMHDWPPIISMSELDGYHFTTGSAELSEGFKRKLRQKSADIAALAKQYRVDVVEVIGHTDKQPISGRPSTWTPT